MDICDAAIGQWRRWRRWGGGIRREAALDGIRYQVPYLAVCMQYRARAITYGMRLNRLTSTLTASLWLALSSYSLYR